MDPVESTATTDESVDDQVMGLPTIKLPAESRTSAAREVEDPTVSGRAGLWTMITERGGLLSGASAKPAG
jgi:hypothetical protein